jgi:hypothetical protein
VSADRDEAPLLEERDAAYIRSEPDPERRAAVRCAVTTYRRPDRLDVGDRAPALELPRLETAGSETIGPGRERPLALFFGSYT